MKKHVNSATLFCTLALMAFSCDPNGTTEDEMVYSDMVSFKVVDPITGKNLVGIGNDQFVYHPDSIRILDKDLNNTEFNFFVCSPDTLPQYSAEITGLVQMHHFPEVIPNYVFYLEFNGNELDTLILTSKFGKGNDSRSDGYFIEVEYNGQKTNQIIGGNYSCGLSLPKSTSITN